MAEPVAPKAAILPSSVFDYKIIYKPDGTLAWEPAVNSKALAIALSYCFPLEKDLESKMRAAIRKFVEENAVIRAENANSETGSINRAAKIDLHDFSRHSPESVWDSGFNATGSELSERSLPAATNDFPMKRTELHPEHSLKVLTWDPAVGIFKGPTKGTKRRYEKVEASKVAANRGKACDEHRRQKVKCDPVLCPRNGQNENNGLPTTAPSNSLGEVEPAPNFGTIKDLGSNTLGREDILSKSSYTKRHPPDPTEGSKPRTSDDRLKSTSTFLESIRSQNDKDGDIASPVRDAMDPIVMSLFHVSSGPSTFNGNSIHCSENLDTDDDNSWWLRDDFGLDLGSFFNDEGSFPEEASSPTSYATPFTNEFYDPKSNHKGFPTVPKSPIPQFQEGIWTSYGCNFDWGMSDYSRKADSALKWDGPSLPIFRHSTAHDTGVELPSIRLPNSNVRVRSCNLQSVIQEEPENFIQEKQIMEPIFLDVPEAAVMPSKTLVSQSQTQTSPLSNTRSMSSVFSTAPDYSDSTSYSCAPDGEPDRTLKPQDTVAGRYFSVPRGLNLRTPEVKSTPVGEGGFRYLMEIGPMDSLNLSWDSNLSEKQTEKQTGDIIPAAVPPVPSSTTTSFSASPTKAIKDNHHRSLSNTLEAERVDRISNLSGLELVPTLHELLPGIVRTVRKQDGPEEIVKADPVEDLSMLFESTL